MTYSIFGDWKF